MRHRELSRARALPRPLLPSFGLPMPSRASPPILRLVVAKIPLQQLLFGPGAGIEKIKDRYGHASRLNFTSNQKKTVFEVMKREARLSVFLWKKKNKRTTKQLVTWSSRAALAASSAFSRLVASSKLFRAASASTPCRATFTISRARCVAFSWWDLAIS